MNNTPFHSYVIARQLAGLVDEGALLPAFASSSIDIFPYQIAAARFAMRSPYLKGCILCDEGSLGKTYEALLVAVQKWYEGKDRLLLVLPPNLIGQWTDKLDNAFTLPYTLWNSGETPPDEEGLVIVTYDYAARRADSIGSKPWDLVIFDEADVLSKPQNKTVSALKTATDGSFKLLLTPTPITMSIMDIYGLIHFIDESVLPDAGSFYKRYFRRPENYPKLTSWVSQFAFRTLRSQVLEYVNFTQRLPFTPNVELTLQERALYEKVDSFLALPRKASYPQMERYDLTLMLYHTLSSSPQAFCKTIEAAIKRAEGDELALLDEIRQLAEAIPVTGKMQALLYALEDSHKVLKQFGLPQKAIVFTDNLTTLDVLCNLLSKAGYNLITSEKPDYIARFRAEKAAVLVATDAAAKGLDMEFCPVVVNYDLLFNAVEMEQRISRCHRQGQKSDVLVINLLYGENFADVRILELINKRTLQFDGIFGMSDPIVGNFDLSIGDVLSQIRDRETIAEAFARNLTAHKSENKSLVTHAEDTLFTTFTKSVADQVTVTPQYIADKTAELNTELWELTRGFFTQREDYHIDEQSKTITLQAGESPTLFYYWTGSRNKPYAGQRQYGMGPAFKPNGGRIALTSPLVRGILNETACADSGQIIVKAEIVPCEIGFYEVKIAADHKEIATFDVFVGRDGSGRVLTEEECRAVFELPVVSCIESDRGRSYWLRTSTGGTTTHPLDELVPLEALKEKCLTRNDSAMVEETERIKLRAARKRSALEHSLDDLRAQVKSARQELAAQSGDRLQELVTGKRLKTLEKELRSREQGLFFEQMRIDAAAEQEMEAISKENYTTQVVRHFAIKVTGENYG